MADSVFLKLSHREDGSPGKYPVNTCGMSDDLDMLVLSCPNLVLDLLVQVWYSSREMTNMKPSFYSVNTSYPMDNCFTGWRDQSRQMPEKDILYIILAGLVTECACTRWRIVLPSCLDSVTS